MNRKLIQVAIALAVVGMTTSAHAGIYADDLGRCFVKSTTEDDRLTLIRWMFGSMTLQPALQAMVTVTP
ncbi:MAG TPA: hypothetical protein VHY80_19320, partial [Stellaceae bacterium]|nr:hypothetical protein [Stellaceae bacterium]